MSKRSRSPAVDRPKKKPRRDEAAWEDRVSCLLEDTFEKCPELNASVLKQTETDDGNVSVKLDTYYCAIKQGEHASKRTSLFLKVKDYASYQSCRSSNCLRKIAPRKSLPIMAPKTRREQRASPERKESRVVPPPPPTITVDFDPNVALGLLAAAAGNEEEDLLPMVLYMNNWHAKVCGDGSPVFVERHEEGVHCRNMKSFEDTYKHMTTRYGNKQYKSSISKIWSNHPSACTKRKIVFDPSPDADPRDFNLWTGFPITPDMAREAVEKTGVNVNILVKPIVDHINTEWCRGNADVHNSVRCWLAHIRQRPWQKHTVAILLAGEQGTGKSLPCKLMQKVLGPRHYLECNDLDRLLGNFTMNQIETNLLINLDEAIFSGDRSVSSKLKSVLTSDERIINQKYMQTRVSKSYSSHLFTTNSHEAVRVEMKDRRFICLEGSNRFSGKGDTPDAIAYFDALRSVDPAWFAHYLDTLDLSSYNPRHIPWTSYRARQMQAALDSVEGWAERMLQEETLFALETDISNTDLYGRYSHWVSTVPANKFQKAVSAHGFWPKLKLLFPAMVEGKRSNRSRSWRLPSIDVAKQSFVSAVGAIDWPWGL